jgi:uncharacterized protein DUF4383
VQERSPTQLFALLIGATLVAAGIAGFFYSATFGSPGDVDAVLGILDVNGWHNLVHIASGAIGLAAVGSYTGSRTYALALAVVYTALAAWGFIIGNHESILGFVPVNTEDNFLHVLIALGGYGAYAATPAVPPPTTVARSA